MKALVLGILLVGVACGQVPVDSIAEDTVEDVRQECPRLLCRMYCALGFHHDANGCPLCACMEDPCEEKECGKMEECRPVPHCNGFPCTSMAAECVLKEIEEPCAMPMCSTRCPAGYATDERGCMTCRCKDQESSEERESSESSSQESSEEGESSESSSQESSEEGESSESSSQEESSEEEEDMSEEQEDADEVCVDHPCPDAHSCVAVTVPMCQLITQDNSCDKKPMCLPEGHDGMFLPHLADHVPGQFGAVPEFQVADLMSTACRFRSTFSEKMLEEAKIKYGNSTGLMRRLIGQPAMIKPWCTEDGRFRPLQCNAPERQCWCVNDRGHALPDTRATIHSKTDVPTCVEHVTERIEGSFLMQHKFDNIEEKLVEVGSVVQDHLAAWMKLDHAQISIRTVSVTQGGLVEVHFELARSDENELHSAQLLLAWQLGMKECRVPFMDGEFVPIHTSLHMQHFTTTRNTDQNDAYEQSQGGSDLKHLYRQHKPLVIAGGVGVVLLVVLFLAIIVTVCKRARVTSNHFKHKRMTEKSHKYKENLAFANELYGKQAEKQEADEEKKVEEGNEEKKENVTDDE